MGWFDNDAQSSYNDFQDTHHASITHELLGGAVAYEATKAYEDHCAANGRPDSHAKAKELLAGFAGAATDRLVETKGLDAWDSYKRNQAQQYAVNQVSDNYLNDQYSSSSGYSNSSYTDTSYTDTTRTDSYTDNSYTDTTAYSGNTRYSNY